MYKRIITHKLWALLPEGDLIWKHDLFLMVIFTPISGKAYNIKPLIKEHYRSLQSPLLKVNDHGFRNQGILHHFKSK